MALGLGLSESEIHSSEHTRRWGRGNPWCPAQWGHFIADNGSLSLVLKEGGGIWQATEEFIWNVLWCCKGLRALQRRENIGGHTYVRGFLQPFPQPGWTALSTLTPTMIWRSSVIYPQNLEGIFCMSDASLWFIAALLTVCPHTLNHTDSKVFSCAQHFEKKHSTKRERERRWTWGSIRESDSGWQESSQLDVRVDSLWQCSGTTPQIRLGYFCKICYCQTRTEGRLCHFKALGHENDGTRNLLYCISTSLICVRST